LCANMATVNGHHASFVDVAGLMGDGPRGESALDTRHLLGALGELADRQSAGDPVLWQLRPRVPASETDTESLAGFTPAFTPSANTPREPHLVVDRPAGVGRWDDAGRGTDAGKQPPGRDTAQRYSGSAASPAPLRDAAKRHRRACPARSHVLHCSAFAAPGLSARAASADAPRRRATQAKASPTSQSRAATRPLTPTTSRKAMMPLPRPAATTATPRTAPTATTTQCCAPSRAAASCWSVSCLRWWALDSRC
jgi:hypothetical protein